MFSRLLSGLLVSAMLLGSALTAQAQQTLNFGIISTEASQNLKVLWDPFLKDMSKALGMEVKAFFASDYAGVIEGMRFKKVDLSWIGNKGAMVMVDRANGEVFAQTTARRQQGLLLLPDRQQEEPAPEPRRHVCPGLQAELQQWRPQLHLRLPGARLLCLCQKRQGSPEDLRPYRIGQP